MSAKPIVRRAIAGSDLEAAVGYYWAEAGEETALRFVAAFEDVLHRIARRPAAGSPRYAHMLGLDDLRMRPTRRYPHLVFYINRGDHIDGWRVLHGGRDVFGSLRDDMD